MNLISIRFLLKEDVNDIEPLNILVDIMVGGKESRLKTYTDISTKPLILVGEITIMEHVIKKLKSLGNAILRLLQIIKKNLI